jgi:hypothetical protein
MLGAGLSSLETWQTWLIALKAAFALPLTEEEREVFRAIAGERGLPKHRVRELWCVAGRRSGKSRMAAAVAIFLALFQKHRLSPGERGMCLVIAEAWTRRALYSITSAGSSKRRRRWRARSWRFGGKRSSFATA